MRVEWIRHHNPDLVITDGTQKLPTIDLSGYSFTKLHELFSQHFPRSRKGRALADAVDGPSDEFRRIDGNSSSIVADASASSLRINEATLPQPISYGWQLADVTFAGMSVASLPTYLLALTGAYCAVALVLGLARRHRHRHAASLAAKPAAMDV